MGAAFQKRHWCFQVALWGQRSKGNLLAFLPSWALWFLEWCILSNRLSTQPFYPCFLWRFRPDVHCCLIAAKVLPLRQQRRHCSWLLRTLDSTSEWLGITRHDSELRANAQWTSRLSRLQWISWIRMGTVVIITNSAPGWAGASRPLTTVAPYSRFSWLMFG